MPENLRAIECCRCGHIWHVNLDRLDAYELIAYKAELQCKDYRAPCPNCGTYNVFTVPVEEGQDG